MTIEEVRRGDMLSSAYRWRIRDGRPRSHRWWRVAALVVALVAVVLAALGWWYRPTVDIGGTWRVVEVDGHVVHGVDAAPDRPASPTVTFHSIGPLGWVDEFDGCMRFGARYTLVGDRFHTSFGSRPANGCATFEEMMPDIVSVLQRTTTVEVQGGVLLLKDSHGAAIMRLTRQSG